MIERGERGIRNKTEEIIIGSGQTDEWRRLIEKIRKEMKVNRLKLRRGGKEG